MRLFAPIYERMMRWAAHEKAPWILAILSFFEAFVFPVPPEVMLAPMTLARPRRGLHFAALSLGASVLGGLVGYAIGFYAYEAVYPWLQTLGYGPTLDKARALIAEHGFWFLLVGGFLPIPFKFLTIAAGASAVPVWHFVAGALIGRGKRVFIVAGAIMLGGERAEHAIRRYVEWIGWGLVIVIVAVLVGLRFWNGGS
jgi:membrane protein YqaA with SNARE-associated domain